MNKLTVLKRQKEYSILHERGKVWHSKLVIMKVLANGLLVNRFGFSVGKEVGNAVARNGLRRRLKEIIRKSEIRPGLDILFVARPEAGKATYQELKETLENLLTRAKLNKRNETVSLRTN